MTKPSRKHLVLIATTGAIALALSVAPIKLGFVSSPLELKVVQADPSPGNSGPPGPGSGPGNSGPDAAGPGESGSGNGSPGESGPGNS